MQQHQKGSEERVSAQIKYFSRRYQPGQGHSALFMAYMYTSETAIINLLLEEQEAHISLAD